MKKRIFCILAGLLPILFCGVKLAAQIQPVKSLDYVIVPPGGGMQLGTGKWKLTTTSTRVISKDGRTMTITTSGSDEKGVAFNNTLILRKQ